MTALPVAAPALAIALDHVVEIAPGRFLACGWALAETPQALRFRWRPAGRRRTETVEFRLIERPDLPDFVEAGARAGLKCGFVGIVEAELRAGEPLRIEAAGAVAGTAQAGLPVLPLDGFADYAAGLPPAALFEIADLLGTTDIALPAAAHAAIAAGLRPWLATLPLCEASASVAGVTIGFDQLLLGEDGQIFVEGWLTAPDQVPELRLALAGAQAFRTIVLDQAVLRPDIAGGSGRRPGFFIAGQARLDGAAGLPAAVLELRHGRNRSLMRLGLRLVASRDGQAALAGRLTDDKVAPAAREALLRFHGRPALPAKRGVAAAGAGRVAAVCVVGLAGDDACRGLILASLARLSARDVTVVIVGDEGGRALAALGPASPGRVGGRLHHGATLTQALTAAGLAGDDAVLFIPGATLIRHGMIEAIEAVLQAQDRPRSHWLFAPAELGGEQEAALQRLMAETGDDESGDEPRPRSVAYLDIFMPLLAPAGDILALASGWTPPLPGLFFREAVRRAGARGDVGLVRTGALSVYRRNEADEPGLARLYRALIQERRI